MLFPVPMTIHIKSFFFIFLGYLPCILLMPCIPPVMFNNRDYAVKRGICIAAFQTQRTGGVGGAYYWHSSPAHQLSRKTKKCRSLCSLVSSLFLLRSPKTSWTKKEKDIMFIFENWLTGILRIVCLSILLLRWCPVADPIERGRNEPAMKCECHY